MFDRLELGFKIGCAVLAVLLLYQAGRFAARLNPLGHLTIPALPVLAAETNAAAADLAPNSPMGRASTNSGSNSLGSSARAATKATNSPTSRDAKVVGTNVAKPDSTSARTNAVPGQSAGIGTTNSTTTSAMLKAATNVAASRPAPQTGSNSVPGQAMRQPATNSAAMSASRAQGPRPGSPPGMPMMGMNPFGGQAGVKVPELAPPVLARVDRITESEVLGPVIRPLPMALLGIAGDVAFLRTPSGQTGLVKQGDELSGVKLLRIGTNRVLVEQDGEKKELTIFSGYGGDALLPQTKDHTP